MYAETDKVLIIRGNSMSPQTVLLWHITKVQETWLTAYSTHLQPHLYNHSSTHSHTLHTHFLPHSTTHDPSLTQPWPLPPHSSIPLRHPLIHTTPSPTHPHQLPPSLNHTLSTTPSPSTPPHLLRAWNVM